MGLWSKKTKKPLERNYVSELDQFLIEFNKKPEASSATIKEEQAIYKRIGLLRDDEKSSDLSMPLWKEF